MTTYKENVSGHIRHNNNYTKVRYLGIHDKANVYNIFTDGSATFKDNDTVGYSFVISKAKKIIYIYRNQIIVGKRKKKLSPLYAETVAILEALQYSIDKRIDNVCIYTDNLYIFKAIKGYDQYLNPVLHAFINRVKRLVSIIYYNGLHVDIKYIKGHSGILENELADFYAKDARKKRSKWKSISDVAIQNLISDFNSQGVMLNAKLNINLS